MEEGNARASLYVLVEGDMFGTGKGMWKIEVAEM